MATVTHLTTALQSNASTNFVQANAVFNGTNASGTIASNAISVSVNPQTAFQFSNSNGVTFGTNGSTVTASVQTNYLTTAALSNHSHNFATTTTNGALIVVGTTNSNGATIGVPPFLTTAQPVGAYLTTARASNDAIGLNTALTANGLSVTANSSGLSINVPAWLTTAALSNHSHGNPTLALTNLSGTTASNSAGLTLSLSAAAPGGGVAISGGANSQSTGTVNFANSNGITFGLSNNGTMTASHNGLTTQSAQAFSADASSTFQTLVFQDSNGVSFSNNAGSLRITHALQFTSNTSAITSNALHTTSPRINVSAGTTSNNLSAITFSNSNGITFGLNASTLTASHNGLTTARASNDGIGLNTAQSNVTWTVNSNGLSLDARNYAGTGTTFNGANVSGSMTMNSNGAQLSLSVAAPGGGVTPALSGSNGSFSYSTATFGNLNGLSFYTSNGSMVGSYTVPSQTVQPVAVSGSNGSFNFSTLSFGNLNGLSFYTSNGSIVGSYTDAGGAGGGIAISGGTNSFSTGTVSFADSNGVSFGLNTNNVMTASINTGGGMTREFYNPYGDLVMVAGQVGQGTLNINPNDFPNATFDRVYMPINITNSSNSSGSHTLSFWLGIYTRNVSTLSLLTSQSTSYALTHSGTAGSYSLYSGMRHISMGISTSLSEGLYYVGIVSRTTSGGANGSYSQMLVSNLNTNFLGHFSSSHNTTYQFRPGLGVYSATTSGIPNSIGISQMRGSDSLAQRPPVIIFANSTI